MSCKVYLVPEDVINTWRAEQRQKTVDDPVGSNVQKSDSNMQSILKSNMSDYDKNILFGQELAKFQSMRAEPSTTPISASISEAMSAPVERHSVVEDQVISSVPRYYQRKAEALLKYIKTNNDIGWDAQGRLILKGQVIEHSHIVDLVHDALRHRKKVGRPTGWTQLRRHLKHAPRELLGNEHWHAQSEEEEISENIKKYASEPPSAKKRKLNAEVQKSKWTTLSPAVFKARPSRVSKTIGQKRIRKWIKP